MSASSRALAVSTSSSLVAVSAVTVSHGPQAVVWVMWACWAALAVATVAILAGERRDRA